MDNKSIPSFFIIGAQKSATSSIHALLSQDNRISLPYRKETHFFSTNFNKSIDWYLSMFKSSKYLIRGEIDPSYIHYDNSLLNIKKYNLNPKFIFIFRQPIERAYSHYLMSVNRNYESLSFNDALNIESERLNNDNNNFSFSNHSYLLRGNYCQQINRCKNVFPNSEYLYIKFDDFINTKTRESIVTNIYNFLNIEYKFDLNYDIHENETSYFKIKLVRDLIYSDNIFKKYIKMIIRSGLYRYKIIQMIEKLNSKKIQNNVKKIDFSKIDNKFIYWNNKQSMMLSEKIKICTDNWIVK